MNWYLHPWRLVTLSIGTSGLLLGAMLEEAADWDIGVSLLMAGITYLFMPLFEKALTRKNWLYAFLLGDFAVNGVYALYWGWINPSALDAIWYNYPASWALFLLCWLVWSVAPKALVETLVPLYHRLQRRG